MAITFGFYNSLNGDRKYNAEQLSNLFDGIINDGVFASIGTSLVVAASTGMVVTVGLGRAWFNHTWIDNDSIYPLTIEQSEVILDRIDSVVVEINSGDDTRANTIKLIKGTPGSVPVAPSLVSTENVHQYALCNILIHGGVTEIIQQDITNLVGTPSCPFITGIIETISIEGISLLINAEWDTWFDSAVAQFNSLDSDWDVWFLSIQNDLDILKAGWTAEWNAWFTSIQGELNNLEADWTADWNAWFATIQGQLNGDIAGNLQTQLNKMILLDAIAPASPIFQTLWFSIQGESTIL